MSPQAPNATLTPSRDERRLARLPPLVAEVGKEQLFIRDGLHAARNTPFEMEQAAFIMTPGGVMLIDDIRGHDAFVTIAKRHPQYQTPRCSTADRAGGFGIAFLPGIRSTLKRPP